MKSYRLTPGMASEEIHQQVARMADQINLDYAGKSLILVGFERGHRFHGRFDAAVDHPG